MSKKALNIYPLEDRVVVEPLAAEEKTAGGLFLPDSAKRSRKGSFWRSVKANFSITASGEWAWRSATKSSTENIPVRTSKSTVARLRSFVSPTFWQKSLNDRPTPRSKFGKESYYGKTITL